MTPSDLGIRLRLARELGELSSRELGRLAGLAATLPQFFETGAKQSPNTATASKLAGVLGVSLDWLITGKGEKPTAASVGAAVKRARARRAAA